MIKTSRNVYESHLGLPELDSKLTFPTRAVRRLIFIFLAIHLALIAATPTDLDMDLGWQISQGRWMVHHGAFYRTDEFNFPNAHQPVVDEYPLFQLMCYVAWCFGPDGLIAFRIFLCLALFLPLIYIERRLPRLEGDFLFPLALVVAASFIDFSLRAQLFSLIFTAIYVIVLTRIREAPDWRKAWPLCVIQVCWVNIHSGFILGPPLAVCIGFEVIFSQLLKGIVNRQSIYSWCILWLALSFLCLVNPYGADRLSLPFYQDNLNLIRIYVAEMHPLSGTSLLWGYTCAATGLVLVLIARFSFGLKLPLGVIAMALIIFHSALSTAKYWGFFVYFIPLIILAAQIISSERKSASSTTPAPTSVPLPTSADSRSPFPVLAPLVLLAVAVWLGYACLKGVPDVFQAWADYREDRTIQPTAATFWIQEKHLIGDFVNRAEVGGWLQQHFDGSSQPKQSATNDQFRTFCDAGLGKFTSSFIQEIALLGDRPNLLPIFLNHFAQSNLIVITSLQSCYWPGRLNYLHYRLVFYTPNSSVWLPPIAEVRPDLQQISPSSVWKRYQQDQEWLENTDALTLVRSLVSLHGSGCAEEAAAIWQRRPSAMHTTDDYWTVVRLLCQDGSPTDPLWDHETAALFYPEALLQDGHPQPNQENAERYNFMALSKFYQGDDEGALAVLHKAQTSNTPDNPKLAILRLKILVRAGKWKEALNLASDHTLYDPLSGEYWGLLASCQEHAHDDASAAQAWQKAIDLAPDIPGVLNQANAFAKRTHNPSLAESVAKWISN